MMKLVKCKIQAAGFALITELVSLMVFGLGVLALSSVSEKSATASSESLQKIHATWLASSLMSKMSMNSENARMKEYSKANLSCTGAATSRTTADLQSLFCPNTNTASIWTQTKPVDVMGDIDWLVDCVDRNPVDAIPCSSDSEWTVTISWDTADTAVTNGMNSYSYKYSF